MTKPVVYLSGPLNGPNVLARETNIIRAEWAHHALVAAGASVICPHSMTRHLVDSFDDADWIEVNKALIRSCDGVFYLNNWATSPDSRIEHKFAQSLRLPAYYQDQSSEALVEWVDSLIEPEEAA